MFLINEAMREESVSQGNTPQVQHTAFSKSSDRKSKFDRDQHIKLQNQQRALQPIVQPILGVNDSVVNEERPHFNAEKLEQGGDYIEVDRIKFDTDNLGTPPD